MRETVTENELRETKNAAFYHALGRILTVPVLRNMPEGTDEKSLREAVSALMEGFVRNEDDPEKRGSVCFLPEDGSPGGVLTEAQTDTLCRAGLAVRYRPEDGFGEESFPFVIDSEGSVKRVYFGRQFEAELDVAKCVAAYVRSGREEVSEKSLRVLEALEAADRASGTADPDHDEAVKRALSQRFTVITGGPGTGKTTVVVRILAALSAAYPEIRIAGAAPTGKAASNLRESVSGSAERMKKAGGELASPAEWILGSLESGNFRCQTLHRWLSERPGGEPLSASNPFPADVLVADECSMMDIGLASRLFRVLDPSRTRLILLGDKNQLAAVGPGSVYADLSDPDGAAGQNVRCFTKSHRFSEDSRLFRLAAAFKDGGGLGAAESALNGEEKPEDSRIVWEKRADGVKDGVSAALRRWLCANYSFLGEGKRYPPVRTGSGSKPEAEDRDALRAFWEEADNTRVLAAVHSGTNGTEAVNGFMERMIRGAGAKAGLHYPGRLVIVTRNSRQLDLSNGDTAVELPDEKGRLYAYFGNLSGGDGVRGRFLPAEQLPEHETAYAITIHKSQGSSYRRLAVTLPSGDGGAGSRELLYTAVTRLADSRESRGELTLFASEAALKTALSRAVQRQSGLSERLSEALGRKNRA